MAVVSGLQETGDILRKIADRCRRPERLLRAEAAHLERLVIRAIDEQRAPNGEPWARTKAGRPALVAFRDSVFASVSRGKVRVQIAHPAAGFHHHGWEHSASRRGLPVLPSGEPDGSPFWTEATRRADAYFSGEGGG